MHIRLKQESARGDSEVMRGVIGRLSVLILDGFKEEKQANPAASGQGDQSDPLINRQRAEQGDHIKTSVIVWSSEIARRVLLLSSGLPLFLLLPK